METHAQFSLDHGLPEQEEDCGRRHTGSQRAAGLKLSADMLPGREI